jgi:hypothetical protein
MELTPQEDNMAKALQYLLDELCVDLGFCFSPEAKQKIASALYCDADQFTREVFRSEGMNPDEHDHLCRQVRERFRKRFGEPVHRDDIH